MNPPRIAILGRATRIEARSTTSTRVGRVAAAALVLALFACGGAPESEEGSPQVASVQIVQPADGATVGASVLVTLEVAGLTIAPAGTM